MYKLINKQTGEEHICQKVVIDGMDYYVSNESPKLNDAVITAVGNIHYIKDDAKDFIEYVSKLGKVLIATNNPNIDVPKVVDEVEMMANYEFDEQQKSYEDSTEMFPFNDSAFLKAGFITGYNKSQETHPFSEEDMIKFAIFYQKHQGKSLEYWGKDLFKIWKEQQPKTLYYE